MKEVRRFERTGGICPTSEGIDRASQIDLTQVVDESLSINDGAILYPGMKIDSWLWKAYAESGLHPADKPVRDFTDEQKHALYYLSDVKTKIIGINMSYQGLIVRLQSSVLSKDKDSLQKHMKGSAATSLSARSSKRKYALPPELSKPATPDATTCAASTSTSRSACSVPSPALQARASLRCWRVCRRTSQSACSSWTKPPIKGSRRSNPATYTGALDAIRKASAKANSTPDNTVKPALFSANSEGACPNCNGTGVIYVEFGFMGCVDVPCEVCEGRSLIRFPAESVSVSSSPREFVAQ